MSVTDIRDAKALRNMGLPLTTPVVDGGELPEPIAKAMEDGFKAATAFNKRIVAYSKNPSRSTGAAMRRAFDKFMAKTAPPAPPVIADGVPESHEPFVIAALLASEFDSIRAEWSDVFERVDAGEEIHVGPPMWPWEPTEASKRRNANPDL